MRLQAAVDEYLLRCVGDLDRHWQQVGSGQAHITYLQADMSRLGGSRSSTLRALLLYARAYQRAVSRRSSLADHVLLQPGVAEGAARIQPLEQADEVRPALVEGGDRGGIGQEDLAPVRARLE